MKNSVTARSCLHGSFLALALLAVSATPPTAFAGIKCWTNKEGVRECGDRLPPEYAQKGHEQISESGIKVTVVEAARSAEELEEAKRLAAVKAEQARIARIRAAEQLADDQVLLRTFTTEEDLLLARDGKLAVIESRIKLAQNRVAKMETNLEQLTSQAAQQERSGRSVAKNLQERIAKVRRRIDSHLSYIDDRRDDQDGIRKQFDADLQRLRALKSGDVQPGEVVAEETPPEASPQAGLE
ncbi:MAG: hypothetical protein QNK18_04545 [Gammaproteobacteria bacterium]|nr:hypothetical protein [Gammaproteobacteria bacterium]